MVKLSLNKLNIKIIDFIYLLSPLGVVKKIVSNGSQHLFEINFHKVINLNDTGIKLKNGYIEDTNIKIFNHNNHGYLLNNKQAIIEISNDFEINEDNISNISKLLKKNIAKDCSKILKRGIFINHENGLITDPEKINILNFDNYQKVDV